MLVDHLSLVQCAAKWLQRCPFHLPMAGRDVSRFFCLPCLSPRAHNLSRNMLLELPPPLQVNASPLYIYKIKYCAVTNYSPWMLSGMRYLRRSLTGSTYKTPLRYTPFPQTVCAKHSTTPAHGSIVKAELLLSFNDTFSMDLIAVMEPPTLA